MPSYFDSHNLHYEKFQDATIECIEDDIPFDIPDSWLWVRFSTVTINRDSERKPISLKERTKIQKTYDYYGASGAIDKVDDYLFNERLLLIGEDGANLVTRSKPIAFFAEGKYWVNNHAHCIDATDKRYLDFICLYINSINLEKYITGAAQPKMNQDNMNSILIPFPPFEEQLRISNYVNELFDFIETINGEKEELLILIEGAKSKILDLAIKGQLVPQDPNDEPASVLLDRIRTEKEELIKQGKIKRDKKESIIFRGEDNSYYEKLDTHIECISHEIPFDIPVNWGFIRLKDLCIKDIMRGKASKYTNKSNILVFAQKCNTKKGIINLSLAQFLDTDKVNINSSDIFMQYNDIVINSTGTGTLGRVGIFEKKDDIYKLPIIPDSHITTVRASKSIVARYVYVLLKSKQPYLENAGEGSTNQKELKAESIGNILIPLPPSLEQNRIITFINKLHQVITEIEKSL